VKKRERKLNVRICRNNGAKMKEVDKYIEMLKDSIESQKEETRECLKELIECKKELILTYENMLKYDIKPNLKIIYKRKH